MEIREASVSDAEAMSAVLEELITAGKRQKAGDAAYGLSQYVQHPHHLHCFVAADEDGKLLGFQSMILAQAGNPYRTPIGWGIIGTHVRPSAARTGVGARLFAATLSRVREEGRAAPAIEAYIAEQNGAALRYYEAMGFRTYAHSDGIVRKAFALAAD